MRKLACERLYYAERMWGMQATASLTYDSDGVNMVKLNI